MDYQHIKDGTGTLKWILYSNGKTSRLRPLTSMKILDLKSNTFYQFVKESENKF